MIHSPMRPTIRNAQASVRSNSVPRHSMLPRQATRTGSDVVRPSGVHVVFCTHLAISARIVTASAPNSVCKSARRDWTKRRGHAVLPHLSPSACSPVCGNSLSSASAADKALPWLPFNKTRFENSRYTSKHGSLRTGPPSSGPRSAPHSSKT